jgi:hypothetical protein
VERLILEGLGTRDESIASHLGSLSHLVRMTLYGTPPDKETGISLRAHRDEHMTTVLAQHEVGGLEVQVGDGRWVAVPPEPGTLTVMAGDQFRVRTALDLAANQRSRSHAAAPYAVNVAGCHQREGAGVRPPRADAERPRALLGAAQQAVQGPGRAARHRRARRRRPPLDVQSLRPRGVQGVPFVRGRAQLERSTQGFLRCGEIDGSMEY